MIAPAASGGPAVNLATLLDAVLRLPAEDREILIQRTAWTLPIERRRALADSEFSQDVLTAAQLAERDQMVAAMAQGLEGSVNARAEAVHGMLLRYASTAYQRDRGRDAPANPAHRFAHRFLTLNNGEVLSASRLRRLKCWLPPPP